MNLSRLLIAFTLANVGTFPHLNAAAAPAPGTTETVKVDINTAEIPALEAVPEIGTEFANAVVGARPFKSVDDLDRVLKIGPEKMRVLKQKVTASAVKPSGPPPARSTPDNRSTKAKPSTINDGEAKDRKVTEERYDRETERREAGKAAEKK